MDCAILGPYSRVDFWSSGRSDSSLPVPYWARDKGGLGLSRQLDLPCVPSEDKLPPFTCGSVTRQRLMKAFVRQFFGDSGKIVEELVRGKVRELQEAWSSDVEVLTCGSDGQNCQNFLPNILDVSFGSISGSHVAQAVFDKAAPFIENVFTENLAFEYKSQGDEGGLSTWNWDELELSSIALESGLFDATEPVIEYSDAEVGYPFKGNQTLWDMCTGLISQVMFTLPLVNVSGHWTTSTAAKLLAEGHGFDYTVLRDWKTSELHDRMDGATPLEQYVSGLLMDSFTASPLFWHYALRHSPTDSTACDADDPERLDSTVYFDLSTVNGLDTSSFSNPTFPVHGFHAFPIGGANRSCLCGWPLVSGQCVIPPGVCAAAQLDSCSYQLNAPGSAGVEAAVLRYWTTDSPVVECPETDISDAWGFVLNRNKLKNSGNLDQDWIALVNPSQQYRIPGSQVVEFSPAGIRLGNLDKIKSNTSKVINPSSRIFQLKSDVGIAAIKRCGDKILESIAVQDFVQDVVDDLFPVSQGLKESAPVSVCLRFSIEYLRQQLLLVMRANGVPSLESRIERQIAVVQDWRLKCSVQLDMLAVCNSNRIFNIIPSRVRQHSCPFSIASGQPPHYVTAGCIVFSQEDDAFFDPCKGTLCDTQGITLPQLRGCVGCALPFDVRKMGVNDTLGVFPVEFLGEDDDHNGEMKVLSELLGAERIEGRLGKFPWRLTPQFSEGVVSGGASAGNVAPGGDWWTAEGFAKDGSAQFCDGIQDWWPKDWNMPVGYHVTLPCTDAAHKTLDSSFAIMMDNDDTWMIFHSMILRNRTNFANAFGVGGMCRRHSYGMPIYTTNTMRVCTRDAKDAAFDPSVPIKPSWGGEYADEHCSESPFDTPWNIQDTRQGQVHPGMLSVGHVPLYFSQSTAENYPKYDSQVRYIRPGVNDTSWSDDCGVDESLLFTCAAHSDCVALDNGDPGLQGRLKCFRGTCILLDEGYCYSHEDCEADGKMCSGEGRCEYMSWQVHNDLPADDVDFDLFAEDCSGDTNEAYSTWGASHWHDIPDVLEMYGLCSYRSWYEFLEFSRHKTVNQLLNGLSAMGLWPDTIEGNRSLWSTEKFRVRRHACDRDYMHYEGMTGCSPRLSDSDKAYSGFFKIVNGFARRTDPDGDHMRSEYARTYRVEGQDYKIGFSKSFLFGDNLKTGFLSQTPADLGLSGSTVVKPDSRYSYCRENLQCIEDEAADTYGGAKFNPYRQVYVQGAGLRPWTWADEQSCGTFGYLVGATCRLDHAILPLYRLLCVDQTAICGVDRVSACQGIADSYAKPSGVAAAAVIADKLNALWDVVAAQYESLPTTSKYLSKMDCSVQLHDELSKLGGTCDARGPYCTQYHIEYRAKNPGSAAGGYYVSANSMREFPFLWYQKCSLMQGKTLDDAAATPCAAWDEHLLLQEFNGANTLSYDALLRYDAGITSAMMREASAKLESDIREYLAFIKGASYDWNKELGFPDVSSECLRGASYNFSAACTKQIIEFALNDQRFPSMGNCLAYYRSENVAYGAQSISRLLKENMPSGLGGSIQQQNFLSMQGTPWNEHIAYAFEWATSSFYNVKLLNTAEAWEISKSTALAPRRDVQSARESTGDASFLKCSAGVANGAIATDAHCQAVYSFLDAKINVLINNNRDRAEAKGYLAFDFKLENEGLDRMRRENSNRLTQCKQEVLQGRLCQAPAWLTGKERDFCQDPANIESHFREASQAAVSTSSYSLKPIPFQFFCTYFEGGWGCYDSASYDAQNAEHWDKLVAETQKTPENGGLRTAVESLTYVIQRLVSYEKRYEYNDYLLRRVFFQNNDGKPAWRFMAQAYKDTTINTGLRSAFQFCRLADSAIALFQGPSPCVVGNFGNAISNSDDEFSSEVANAFIQAFVTEAYAFSVASDDLIGCFNQEPLYQSKHYGSDKKFKLKDVSGGCQWNCAKSTAAGYSCTQNTETLLSQGYARLKTAIQLKDMHIFQAAPPVPSPLSFHKRSESWSFVGGLDLQSLRSYEQDILTLGPKHNCLDGQVIQYRECNQSDAYLEAAQNYRARGVMRGGPRIPSQSVLFWGGLQYLHGISATLPTWSNHSRESRKTYAKWVMDPIQTCALSDSYNSICLTKGSARYPVSPWTSGDFNPFELCDTTMSAQLSATSASQEVIDMGFCHEDACGSDPNSPFFSNQPSQHCRINEGGTPSIPNVPHTVDQYDNLGEKLDVPARFKLYNNNLCASKPIVLGSCNHQQGMLAGAKGSMMRQDLPSEQALYGTVPFGIDYSQKDRGLFLGGGNPLIYKGEARLDDQTKAATFIHPGKFEIGGTHMVLKVAQGLDGVPLMYIDKAPLSCTGCDTDPAKRIENALKSSVTHGLTGWLRNLEANVLLEQDKIDKLYPRQALLSNKWSCPLRRIAFYTNAVDDPNFSPLTPNPLRAARIFNDVGERKESMNFHTRSHPAAAPSTLKKLTDVFTPNGFCMCTSTSCAFSSSHPTCSYLETLKSVYDEKWRDTAIQRSASQVACFEQVDWPYEAATMRDSTSMAGKSREQPCDLTPRLPKFQFRYASKGAVQRQGKTTLDPGGACHMGIPGEWNATNQPAGGAASYESSLCTKVGETDSNITVSCVINQVNETYVLPKKSVKAPQWVKEAMQSVRKRCDQCSPLPKWKYIYKNEYKNLPQAEVSYGVPFRWSSARMLASSAKAAICGSRSNQSEACLTLLNSTSWQAEQFMRLLVEGGVEQLLNGPQTDRTPGLKEQLSEPMLYSEDALWNESGWVACTQERKSRCFGTIPKAVWEGPGRHQACMDEYVKQMSAQGSIQDSAVGIDVCTLDYGLNELCRVIAEAKQKVTDANCLLSGDCSQSRYVYSPGFYSLPNSEFSRTTVIDYYKYYAGTDEACPLESEELELRSRNDKLYSACASTQLEAVQIGLRIARQVVHVIVKVMYIQIQLSLSVLKLVATSVAQAADSIVREIEFWFQQLVNVIFDAVEEIGNLLYKMIMNTGGLGQVLEEIIKVLCLIAQFLVKNVWNTIACPILKNVTAPILNMIKTIIQGVLSLIPWIDTGDFFEIFQKIIDFLYNLGCNDELSCAFMESREGEIPSGALPVTTRCFADYVPSLDDPSPYSCTRSDTCSVPAFSYGTQDVGGDRLDVCDACPVTNPDVLNRYGCDMYTQTCSCATQKKSRDFCTSNDQCQLPDAQCALVSDFTTGTSYGGTPCALCRLASPVCLKTKAGAGTCSCLLQAPIDLQKCTYTGQSAFPDPSALCGLANQDMSTQSKYEIPWNQLSVVPCGILSTASTFCVRSEGYGNIVVGFNAPLGRRLLTYFPQDSDARIPSLDHADWSHVSDPCRLLAQASDQNHTLSVTEEYTLEWCFRRRDLANYTISKLNLTRFVNGDHFLLSFTDFVDVASRRGALKQILFESPVVEFIIQHSKMLKGVRRVVESIVVSAILFMDKQSGARLPNVTDADAMKRYRDAQLAAFQAMFVQPQANQTHAETNRTRTDAWPNQSYAETNRSARRMLSVQFDDPRLNELQEFWENLRSLPKTGLAGLTSSFEFPPPLLSSYGGSCAAATGLLDAVVNSGLVLKRFFETYQVDPPLGAWNWNIPSFNSSGSSHTKASTGNVFYDIVINDALDPLLGINPQSMANFFSTGENAAEDAWTFQNMLGSAIRCDYEELMLCQKPRRRLLTGIIMAIAVCFVGGYIMQNVGTSFPMWPFVPVLSLWLAYGSAPTCAPMLSTCLWPDLFDTIQRIVPAKIHWPAALQKYPGCLPTRNVQSPSMPPANFSNVGVGSARCLKPCSTFAFDSFQSTLAWAACSIQPNNCAGWDLPVIGGMQIYTQRFAPVVQGTYGDDVRDAHTYCFFTTIPSSAPYLIMAAVILIIVLSLARVPLKLFAAALHTIVHAVCYSHVQLAQTHEGDKT